MFIDHTIETIFEVHWMSLEKSSHFYGRTSKIGRLVVSKSFLTFWIQLIRRVQLEEFNCLHILSTTIIQPYSLVWRCRTLFSVAQCKGLHGRQIRIGLIDEQVRVSNSSLPPLLAVPNRSQSEFADNGFLYFPSILKPFSLEAHALRRNERTFSRFACSNNWNKFEIIILS